MNLTYLIETPRLRLRQFNLNDGDFIIKLVNTPGWLKFIGDRNVHTSEQAVGYLKNGPLKSYQLNGYGLSLVERKEDNVPIGMCGILKRDTLDTPDIGFAFLPEVCGQGYAFEIVGATLTHVREKFSLTKIAAVVMPGNVKSIALLAKLEFRFEKKIRLTTNAQELLLYSNE